MGTFIDDHSLAHQGYIKVIDASGSCLNSFVYVQMIVEGLQVSVGVE